MLSPDDYEDIVVTIAHPYGDLIAPLSEWIERGPGPRRYVEIIAAKRISSGEQLDLAEIPLEYHNTPGSRSLQRQGVLPCPWGPPPDER